MEEEFPWEDELEVGIRDEDMFEEDPGDDIKDDATKLEKNIEEEKRKMKTSPEREGLGVKARLGQRRSAAMHRVEWGCPGGSVGGQRHGAWGGPRGGIWVGQQMGGGGGGRDLRSRLGPPTNRNLQGSSIPSSAIFTSLPLASPFSTISSADVFATGIFSSPRGEAGAVATAGAGAETMGGATAMVVGGSGAMVLGGGTEAMIARGGSVAGGAVGGPTPCPLTMISWHQHHPLSPSLLPGLLLAPGALEAWHSVTATILYDRYHMAVLLIFQS